MKKVVYILFGFIGLLFSSIGNAQSFYSADSIQKIELFFQDSNWDFRLDTAKLGSGTYLMGSVKLNGNLFDSVGVKYKGNSSFDSLNAKNPFHIELNTFKEQNYQGYTDIKLSNGYGDPSLIREVLSYKILNNYMTSPKSAFAEVYANEKYVGLYASAESVNEKFCERNFKNENGVFIKGNPSINPGPSVKSNLKYLGEDTSLYYTYYELKSSSGWSDLKDLCRIISNNPDSLSLVFDIDKALWMLAFNNLFVNLDSYSGVFAQNYYLYKDPNNRFNPIIWDVNMAFGAFPFAGSPGNGMGSLSVSNMQQFSPVYHSTHADWPLMQTLLSNVKLKKKYIAHLRTMMVEMLDSNICFNLADTYQSKVRNLALADSNKFFNSAQFEGALVDNYTFGSYQVPGIKTLMNARAIYLKSNNELKTTAPVINQIAFSNEMPSKQTEVIITVQVSNATQLYFNYRSIASERFAELELFDDGSHNDGAAADGIFANSFVVKSASTQYYVYAENNDAGVFSPARAQHEFYYLGIQPSFLPKGKVFINEFLASNNKSDINEYGIFTDWIEFYNSSSQTVNLYGSYLSDDIKNPFKYAFPSNSTIESGKFLMVWADGLSNSSKYLHSNFTLASSGDEILLSNSKGDIIDSVSFGSQSEDVSFGRCPDASANFVQIFPATFMDLNKFFCANAIDEKFKNVWNVFPNPAIDVLYIESSENFKKRISIHELFGKEILLTEYEGFSTDIDISSLKCGIYLLKLTNQNGQSKSYKIIKNQ